MAPALIAARTRTLYSDPGWRPWMLAVVAPPTRGSIRASCRERDERDVQFSDNLVFNFRLQILLID